MNNNVVPLNGRNSQAQDRGHQEASEWIARLDRGLNDTEAEQLDQWLAASPEHISYLMETAQLWDKMDSLQRLSSLFPEPRYSYRPLYLGLASSAALLLICAMLWLFWPLSSPTTTATPLASSPPLTDQDDTRAQADQVYQTAIGEQSTVTLQDGTQMVLNTDSKVAVYYSEHSRELLLRRGELFVDVAKDPARPLSVIAGSRVMQAIGTAFNVEITRDQSVELVVLEGRVKVGEQDQLSDSTTVSQPNAQTLIAGESLLMNEGSSPVKTVSSDDIAVKLSWHKGNLIFQGESLEEAVREIERYTSVEFIFRDESLKQLRVAGLFRAGDVDGLLATLRQNFNIAHEYTNEHKVELNSAH